MDKPDIKLSDDELNQLNKISWEDAESELIQNREMIRTKKDEAKSAKKPGDEVNVDSIIDLPLNLVAEIGKKRLTIEELLAYKVGSIIEIEKRIGESLNILVNGVVIGEGTIAVQNQRFCVKITKMYDHINKMDVIAS